MSTLRHIERDAFEQLFGMSSGYVLDFSNRTFSEFFKETTQVEIYGDRYAVHGDSKARRLRTFMELESDGVVGKALLALLEYRRYRNGNQETQTTFVAKANEAVARLLGKPIQQVDSVGTFLQQDFGQVALEKIPTVGSLAQIIESRMNEAARCVNADAPLAVIFHCGSILEGLLLGVASANARTFNQVDNSPKDKAGNVKQFHSWTLSELIDVACELGYIRLDVKKFSHGLRDFRNYIHPYEQMNSGFQPDRHTAEICLQVLRAAIASLSGERKAS